jgi:hypothetical protein
MNGFNEWAGEGVGQEGIKGSQHSTRIVESFSRWVINLQEGAKGQVPTFSKL